VTADVNLYDRTKTSWAALPNVISLFKSIIVLAAESDKQSKLSQASSGV